jgi:uncharacterized protein involved in exopolysaccharide biosynthesis
MKEIALAHATEQHLSDYLAILRRRKRQVLRTAVVIFALGVVLAFTIPPVYRSEATILIEQQEVPRDLVASTVTGYMNQRLQVVQQRVLTNTNLLEIARKVKLYPPSEQPEVEDRRMVAEMRRGITVKTVDAQVTDPRSGEQQLATVSFTVSYDSGRPEVAQAVASELAQLFLNENVRMRTQHAEATSGFLGGEEERLRAHLDELGAKLAAYKERNTGRLPELMNMNLSLLERSQKEADDTDRQITNLEERKLELQGQLAQVDPFTGNSPGGRLRQAETEYLSAMAKYSPDHPDVVRARREVESLKKAAGVVDTRSTLESEYKRVSGELAAARQTYGEKHPDVVRLTKSQAVLAAKLKQTPAAGLQGFSLKPDNPAYIALQTQLDTVNLNLKAVKEERARAQQRAAEYEQRVVQTPKVEEEGLALQREYDSAAKKYAEIKAGLLGAQVAVDLEKHQRGGRFSLLQPPQLPDSPRVPNRKAFILLGLVLGFGGGIGYASYLEYMDRTIRGSRTILGVLHASPLAVIPYIQSGAALLPGNGAGGERGSGIA